MTRFGWLVGLGIVLCIAIIAAVTFYVHAQHAASVPVSVEAAPAVVDPSSLAIYTSGTYGFSFFYPASATLTDVFASSGPSSIAWRENTTATGTLLARVETMSGEARVGESTASKGISECTKPSPAEHALGTAVMGSTTWSTFSFDRLGTDDPTRVKSYRAVHDGTCIALETFEPLSAASTSAAGPETVVKSFTFAPAQ
ncbi:MAG: hypothetical protein V4480_00175 [Patescibacteria group bacterium]